MPLSPGEVLTNRYRIVALLGQGGMGAVYRAWDLNLKKPAAIKENLEASPEGQQQFEYEARILSDLTHPNLPRVTDFFFLAGQGQYLAMDFVEGEDLQSMIAHQGRLPEEQTLPWILQICDALEYLHSQTPAIIHRDIKPANIKIKPNGKAILVDFGIAKLYSPTQATSLGAKAVTPGFSPPEQYGGGHTDQRSDIYALGATLYALLTGQAPPESVHRMAGTRPAQPLRQVNPQISQHVEQAVQKALDVNADNRFQSIAEFRQALKEAPTPVAVKAPVVATARVEVSAPKVVPPRPAPAARPAPVAARKARRKAAWLPLVVVIGLIALAGVAWLGMQALPSFVGIAEATGILPTAPATKKTALTPTQAAVNLPLPTESVLPTATQAAQAELSPTPPLPGIVDVYLAGAHILLDDDLNRPSRLDWQFEKNVYPRDGVLQIQGQAYWEAKLNWGRQFPEGNGVILRFRYSQGAEFESYIQTGEWDTDAFKRFGFYFLDTLQTSNWDGKSDLGYQPLQGPLEPAPDSWLMAMIAAGPYGEFIALIWSPDNPAQYKIYRASLGVSWTGKEWLFGLNANKGALDLDEFMQIGFESLK